MKKTKSLFLLSLLLLTVFFTTACQKNQGEATPTKTPEAPTTAPTEAPTVPTETPATPTTVPTEVPATPTAAPTEVPAAPTEAPVEEAVDNAVLLEAYQQAMEELAKENLFPNGQEAQPDEMFADANSFAIVDVDGDLRDELLVNYPGAASTAGMGYFVFEYKPETKSFHEELVIFPSVTIYDNGIIFADASHNQGPSNLVDFWPYMVYRYNKNSDIYEQVAFVEAVQKDAEEGFVVPFEFPTDKDVDGDGVLYLLTDANSFEVTYLDEEAYGNWIDSLISGAKRIEPDYKALNP